MLHKAGEYVATDALDATQHKLSDQRCGTSAYLPKWCNNDCKSIIAAGRLLDITATNTRSLIYLYIVNVKHVSCSLVEFC